MLREAPREHFDVGVAHEVLSEDVDAVIDMGCEHDGKLVDPSLARVVVVVENVRLRSELRQWI